jgi:mono/diheme cytochrome c family protein
VNKALFALALCALASGCIGAKHVDPGADALVADGRAIATTQCSGCHATGTYGESPAEGAPPFRHILERYSGEALSEDLIEGIRVAHVMPAFQFDPKGADALIAYLRTIQTSEPIDRPESAKP